MKKYIVKIKDEIASTIILLADNERQAEEAAFNIVQECGGTVKDYCKKNYNTIHSDLSVVAKEVKERDVDDDELQFGVQPVDKSFGFTAEVAK